MTGADAIREAADDARPYTPEPPRPLFRDLPDPEPFPIEALGDLLAPAAMAIHDIIQAPLPVGAQSVLATATLAAQAGVNVTLPYGGDRPLSGFYVSILESGERKTAADDLASAAIGLREDELRVAYHELMGAYEIRTAIYDAEWKRVTNDKKLLPSDKEAELSVLGPKPQPPRFPMIACGEPTYEGLFRLLQQGPRSVGICSSEGGQLIGGYALSDDHRLKTAAGLSEGWDGKPWKRVRGGDGLILLPNRRVTLNLMVQPLVAARLLGDPLLRDQGLLSRMLVTAPAPASGTRFWKEAQPHSRTALAVYTHRVLELLRRSPIEDDAVFPTLTFTATARRLWTAFADSIEGQLGPDGALSTIRGLANKAPEHAARIAGVLETIVDPETRDIHAETLTAGIELVQFYLSEAVRLQEGAQLSAPLRRAATLLQWLRRLWPHELISLVDIYQRGPREFRHRQEAAATVIVLEEHGWLAPLEGMHEVAGVRRSEVWRIAKG